MSYKRPSSWTPDIPGWFPVDWHFKHWKPVFWVGVWAFIMSAVAVGVRLAEALP